MGISLGYYLYLKNSIMKIFKFFVYYSFIVIFSVISASLLSCNSEQTSQSDAVCDSLAIYKKFRQDHLPEISMGGFEKAATTLAFKSKLQILDSDPIPTETAISEHLEFLKGDLTLKDESGRTIHYLNVSKNSLSALDSLGEGGMRLYFSQLKGPAPEYQKFLSIILVPVDKNDDNVIKNDVQTCFNTLEPCPDKCALKSAYSGPGSKNSKKDLNYDAAHDRWYKKNLNNDKPWVKEDNSEHSNQVD